jgi:starvation-inducible DNA-binding protein
MDHVLVMDGKSGNEALAICLTECLSNTVVLKFKAQGHHWNVKGSDFAEFHSFFGKIYEEAEEQIDAIGELIRFRGKPAVYRLTDFANSTSISDAEVGSDALAMVRDLRDSNLTLLACLNDTFNCAQAVNDQGIMDTLAGIIGSRSKLNWMLSSFLGEEAPTELPAHESALEEMVNL